MSEDDIKKPIDVDFQDIHDEVYLTAPQVAQKIKDTDIRVRHWADVFGDLIGIEKLNGRKRYKESDVYKFSFIKDLLDNKNFKHDQAKIYIAKHGFKYAEYDSGLIDPQDPLGFQVLASALSVEVNKQLSEFKEDLINQVDDRLKSYMMIQGEAIKDVLSNTVLKVDEVVTEKLDENLEQVKTHIDETTEKSNQLQQHNQKILEELSISIAEIKEHEKKIAKFLDDPESREKVIKKTKDDNDKFLSKLAKKMFGK